MQGAKRSTRGHALSTRRLRRVGQKGYTDVAFLLEIFAQLPDSAQMGRPDGELRFTEIDTPRALL